MRRVLLVTYDFPPVGGSSVQRVAKFAKYLPQSGWEPVVLTTRQGRLAPSDDSLLADVEGVEIHRTVAPDPFRLLVRLRALFGTPYDPQSESIGLSRATLLDPRAWVIPDGKIGWIPFGLHWALTVPIKQRCDVVFSTLPTPTSAILGWVVSRAWQVPHVVDYRDPWTGSLYLPRRLPVLQRLERALERRILSDSSAAVCVRPDEATRLRALARNPHLRVEVIHNGYDESDFRDIRPIRPAGDFVIAHVGALWEGRDMGALLGALQKLLRQRQEPRPTIHVVQVGGVDSYVARQVRRASPYLKVSVCSSVRHREALAYALGADLLYLPTIQNYVPAKTYEYLRTGVPILAVGSRGTNLRSVLSETGAGETFGESDIDGIANHITRVMEEPAVTLGDPSPEIAAFSREANAGRLAQILEEVSSVRSVALPASLPERGE